MAEIDQTRVHETMAELCDALLSEGALDAPDLARARRGAQASGQRIDHVLISLGLATELDVTTTLARLLRLPIATLEEFPPQPVLVDLVLSDAARRHRLVPLSTSATEVAIAVVDPFNPHVAEIAYLTNSTVTKVLVTPTDFEKAVTALYPVLESNGGSDTHGEPQDEDLERLRDLASQAPTIRLVNQLIADAIEQRASDIHVEPQESAVLIRYRVDGDLRIARHLPPGQRSAVTTRIKVMASLDIGERRLPQDGRMKTVFRGQDLDFRVSTTPTLYGESIVLRILDRARVKLDFSALGFQPEALEKFRKIVREPNGIILVTGPTGSGKTTTLYTALSEINRPNLKIFTVEDPIEYHLTGVNQIQVQPKIGFDFAAALRSILRQDPDIVMIGEIRDLETAQIAIQASLTGHLVLSTLHTNSAAGAVARLLDMGVEDYLLASTLKGVLAQRLVRRLCPHCAVAESDVQVSVQIADAMRLDPKHLRLQRAVGCESCGHIGFLGRTMIGELLCIDDAMQRLIVDTRSEKEIDGAAKSAGMRSLYMDGLAQVVAGNTTLGEVLSVVSEA